MIVRILIIIKIYGQMNIGKWLFYRRKIYNYKRKIYEEKVVIHVKNCLMKSNKSIMQGDISFDEVNEKDFLENGSFLSINNDSFLLSNDLMRKSTIHESI